MDTLKQLQEKGEEIIPHKWLLQQTFTPEQYQYLLNFLHQQTTLAFEAGKAEAIAMVLKEIKEIPQIFSIGIDTDTAMTLPSQYNLIDKNSLLDIFKTKLQAKE